MCVIRSRSSGCWRALRPRPPELLYVKGHPTQRGEPTQVRWSKLAIGEPARIDVRTRASAAMERRSMIAQFGRQPEVLSASQMYAVVRTDTGAGGTKNSSR